MLLFDLVLSSERKSTKQIDGNTNPLNKKYHACIVRKEEMIEKVVVQAHHLRQNLAELSGTVH